MKLVTPARPLEYASRSVSQQDHAPDRASGNRDASQSGEPLKAKRPKGFIPTPNITSYGLMQIAAVIDSVRARLLEADPDIERDNALYIDCMDGESDAIDYMRQLGRAYLDRKAFKEAIGIRIANMKVRYEREERQEVLCKGVLQTLMDVAQIPKIPDTDFYAGFYDGHPKVNEDIDEHIDKLPERYVVTKRSVNKALLLEDLKKGVKVEHAYITNGAEIFTIRGK
jgi:hypothetical protein